ncbi:hypothetical protein HZC31_01445 [Candidatus Woesearchaeota archaeon]|nr:hypothetical protein [Candidatus Woesearchaeota archaeon]
MNKGLLFAISVLISALFLPAVFAAGLGFSDIDVEIDGESDDDVDASGGSFEAAPGDNIDLTVEIENTFSSGTIDHNIKNIDIMIELNSFCPQNSDDEIDEEIRIDNLDPGADDSATFRFTIPDCAEEDNFDLDIRVEGKDEDGTEYAIDETIFINVDKKPSEVTLDLFQPEPQVLDCEDRTFSIAVEAHNIGSLDEDAGLLIINNDLGVNRFEFMDLRTGSWTDEDTMFEKTYTFVVDEDVEAGDYDIRAEVEYNSNNNEIKRFQTVTVPECSSETADVEETNDDEAEEPAAEEAEEAEAQDEEPAKETTSTTVTIPATEESAEETANDDSSLSIPLLAGALAVGLFILFAMIMMLVKKK